MICWSLGEAYLEREELFGTCYLLSKYGLAVNMLWLCTCMLNGSILI